MSNILMSTRFLAWGMLKLKLELNVNSLKLGVIMLKLELELNVNSFEHRGINVNIAAPGRAMEGDRILVRSSKVWLG